MAAPEERKTGRRAKSMPRGGENRLCLCGDIPRCACGKIFVPPSGRIPMLPCLYTLLCLPSAHLPLPPAPSTREALPPFPLPLGWSREVAKMAHCCIPTETGLQLLQ